MICCFSPMESVATMFIAVSIRTLWSDYEVKNSFFQVAEMLLPVCLACRRGHLSFKKYKDINGHKYQWYNCCSITNIETSIIAHMQSSNFKTTKVSQKIVKWNTVPWLQPPVNCPLLWPVIWFGPPSLSCIVWWRSNNLMMRNQCKTTSW